MTTQTPTTPPAAAPLVETILMVTPDQSRDLEHILGNAADDVSDLEYIAQAITNGQLTLGHREA